MDDERKIYVITGGPGVGKSTLIDLLREKGYTVVTESAREVIEEEQERGSAILPWENLEAFQEKVAERQIRKEDSVAVDEFFVDRGIIDNDAYARSGNVRIPESVKKFSKHRYKKVFFLEPLPDYVNDNQRKESKEDAAKLHKAIRRAYERYGYRIIDVPFMEPKKRVEFILKKVHEKGVKVFAQDFVDKYERHLSVAALLGGFIFDSLTLTRIDRLYDNMVVIVYILICALGIFLVNLYETGRLKAKIFRFYHRVFPIVIQFAFGGLFSAFTVFYSRSSDLSGSWPFLLVLVGLLVGNEFLKKYYRRFTLQLAILYFVIFSYFIFITPIILRKMGDIVFLASGVLSLVAIFSYLRFFKKYMPEVMKQSGLWAKTSIYTIFVVVNILYFYNYIPPIPLSLNDAGIYHDVFRNIDGDYVVESEKQPWYRGWFLGDVLHVEKNDTLFAFSSVYAPVDLSTKIVHRWQRWDEQLREWQTVSVVPFSVKGGRLEGYRGYSEKINPVPGKWRVSIETESKQVIGRKGFVIKEKTKDTEVLKRVL